MVGKTYYWEVKIMERDELTAKLAESIESLQEKLKLYSICVMEHEEFVNSVWMTAEVLAKFFCREKIILELREVEAWK